MLDPELLRADTFPTYIVVMVVAMVLWALAFTRLAIGFRTIVDGRNGIRVAPLQVGWVVFAWAFLFVSFWPVLDTLVQDEWFFGDLLLVVVGGLLFYIAAAAIAPDGTYKDADGDARYLEVAPVFFGLFALYQAWLVVTDTVIFGGADEIRVALSLGAIVLSVILVVARKMSIQKPVSVLAWILAGLVVILQSSSVIEGTLVRPEELAPLQGTLIAIWLGCIALVVLMMVALTMIQMINRHSGFRPYVTHVAWAGWFFFWMLLIWWRSPLLVTDGWDYVHLLFLTAGPLLLFLAWTFLTPSGTDGDVEEARAQYFDKAPQGFGLLALVAAWAALFNLLFFEGTTALLATLGWVVGAVLFVVISRSKDSLMHGAVVALAWVLLIAEFGFELERGVPSL